MAYHRATGKVTRLFPDRTDCYIRLDFTPPSGEPKPKDDYFRLEKSHANYNSLYSLAVVAAVNGYNLQIRTSGEIVAAEYPTVAYMVVDW